jgi:hypothetical protein
MIWHTLTQFWAHHGLLFTRFGTLGGWRDWNIGHFRWLDLDDWHRFGALWSWVNVHG